MEDINQEEQLTAAPFSFPEYKINLIKEIYFTVYNPYKSHHFSNNAKKVMFEIIGAIIFDVKAFITPQSYGLSMLRNEEVLWEKLKPYVTTSYKAKQDSLAVIVTQIIGGKE